MVSSVLKKYVCRHLYDLLSHHLKTCFSDIHICSIDSSTRSPILCCFPLFNFLRFIYSSFTLSHICEVLCLLNLLFSIFKLLCRWVVFRIQVNVCIVLYLSKFSVPPSRLSAKSENQFTC